MYDAYGLCALVFFIPAFREDHDYEEASDISFGVGGELLEEHTHEHTHCLLFT